MPLPLRNMPWPPPGHKAAYQAYHEWSAWYAGDVDALSSLYTPASVATDPKFSFRSQYAGGFFGRVARMFWGTPIPPGSQNNKIHVPAASDIASMSADLLFYHPPVLHVDPTLENAQATQDRLEEIFDDDVMARLTEGAEVASALSGVFLKGGWDEAIDPDKPIMSAVHPDCAVPTFNWGHLVDVTFWRVVGEKDGSTYRHLEFHEPGYVSHGLYCGNGDDLGRLVPLDEMPATADYAALVDEEGRIPTGITMLDAVYIPNARPNRKWRNKPQIERLGRSDLSGIEPLMDSLDEAYTSWMRDLRLGKGRIMIPQSYLDVWGKGQGASFNLDREVFTELNSLGDTGGANNITVSQFSIRYAEHLATCEQWWERIIGSAGYSAQTFGFAGEMAMTATESNARERKSMITRGKKIRYWKMGLGQMAQIMLALDNAQFSGHNLIMKPEIEFPEFLQDMPQTRAQTAQALYAAQAASTDTLVRMVNPDWDDDRVKAEVALIQSEHAMPVANPFPDMEDGATEDNPANDG